MTLSLEYKKVDLGLSIHCNTGKVSFELDFKGFVCFYGGIVSDGQVKENSVGS